MTPERRALKLLKIGNHQYCSVTWRGGGIERKDGYPAKGIAEASVTGNIWWINRVLVKPPSARNNGVGGHLLETLCEVIVGQGGTEIVVSPGGYEGDTERQIRFYEAHGFTTVEQSLMCWSPKT